MTLDGIQAIPHLRAFDANNDGLISDTERSQALTEWHGKYASASARWSKEFGERYRPSSFEELGARSYLHRLGDPLLVEASKGAAAVMRQQQLQRRILTLGPKIITLAWLRAAVDRYFGFLELARENPRILLVPTLDIDLIWHAHMLSPGDYRSDCDVVLGKLLKHNDNVPAGELGSSFQHTQQLWEKKHGKPYVAEKPSSQRGISGGSACGSCGWGDEHFHRSLPHQTIEQQQTSMAAADEQISVAEDVGSDTPAGFIHGTHDAGGSWGSHEIASVSSQDNVSGSWFSDWWGSSTWSTSDHGGGSEGSSCSSCGGGD